LTHKVLGARDRVRDPERRALVDVVDFTPHCEPVTDPLDDLFPALRAKE